MTVYPYSYRHIIWTHGEGAILLITRFPKVTPWMYVYV